MKITQKSGFACFAMILMILAGSLAGSHNSLAAQREEAAAVFSAGINGDGIGIQGDLNERESVAYNMITVGRKYLPEDNALMRNVLDAREALTRAETVAAKADANRALDTAVRDLYQVLNGMRLAEQDAKYPQRLYTDFMARGDTISHDPYNSRAAGFNELLSAFPAGVLGRLTGVEALELFE